MAFDLMIVSPNGKSLSDLINRVELRPVEMIILFTSLSFTLEIGSSCVCAEEHWILSIDLISWDEYKRCDHFLFGLV